MSFLGVPSDILLETLYEVRLVCYCVLEITVRVDLYEYAKAWGLLSGIPMGFWRFPAENGYADCRSWAQNGC